MQCATAAPSAFLLELVSLVTLSYRPSIWVIFASCFILRLLSHRRMPHRLPGSDSSLQVLAYEANIEAAVLAQDAGTTPLPEDYTQFIPKVCT